MTTNITGFSLLLGGALLWFGTRWAGVTWGRAHRCWIAVGIRVTFGLLLYGTAVSIGMWGASGISAQTFSPDSQIVGTARRGLSVDDRRELADLRALVNSFIDEQHQVNTHAAGERRAIIRRLDQIEDAHPSDLARDMRALQKSSEDSIAERRDWLKLLIPIIGAIVVGFILDWWKRKRTGNVGGV